jgi:hypothetical protein
MAVRYHSRRRYQRQVPLRQEAGTSRTIALILWRRRERTSALATKRFRGSADGRDPFAVKGFARRSRR